MKGQPSYKHTFNGDIFTQILNTAKLLKKLKGAKVGQTSSVIGISYVVILCCILALDEKVLCFCCAFGIK